MKVKKSEFKNILHEEIKKLLTEDTLRAAYMSSSKTSTRKPLVEISPWILGPARLLGLTTP